MKNLKIILLLLLIFSATIPAMAKVSTIQLMYLVRQAFPDTPELCIFIDGKQFDAEQQSITRAAMQFNFKATIHRIDNTFDISNGVQKTADNSLLLIYDGWELNNSKNKLYIMSRCKEKKVAVITTSPEYVQSGALLGVVDKDGASSVILNLTHYNHLKSRFTPEIIQQIGVNEVIPKDYLSVAN